MLETGQAVLHDRVHAAQSLDEMLLRLVRKAGCYLRSMSGTMRLIMSHMENSREVVHTPTEVLKEELSLSRTVTQEHFSTLLRPNSTETEEGETISAS